MLLSLALLGGCGRESAEMAEVHDDIERFAQQPGIEYDRLVAQIERFKAHEHIMAERIPLDVERFLEWRKRSWWHLREELAYHMLYEWETVEKLADDVARCVRQRHFV